APPPAPARRRSSRASQCGRLALVDHERIVEHLALEGDAVDVARTLEADEACEHVVADALRLALVRMAVAPAAAQRVSEQLARLEHDLVDRVELALGTVAADLERHGRRRRAARACAPRRMVVA